MEKYSIHTLLRILLWSVLPAIGLQACVDDFPVPSGWDETYDFADEVAVPMSLSLRPMKSVDPESRAEAHYPADPDERTIADIWIIEYNEEGVRVGLPKFYDYYDKEEKKPITIDDDGNPISVTENQMILLPREDDHEYTVVAIANTHNGNLFNPDNRSKFSTLDSLRNFDIIIHNQEDLFDPHPEDNHEYKYLLMSGWTKVSNQTTEFTIPLIRNTCKINVKLKEFNDEVLELKYYQWVDVPMGKLYVHGTPGKVSKESRNLDFRMHNEGERLDSLLDPDVGVTFWIPSNVWLPEEDFQLGSASTPATAGEADDIDLPEAPTHFDIVCRKYDEEEDYDLYEFRIYPSRDAKKQFHFEANHFYQIEVDIPQIPGEENDFFKKTVFKNLGVANSFILKQDTKGVYTIPVDRINVFWGYYDVGNKLYEGTEWVAEVIWQDTDQRVVDFAINATGEISPDRSRYFGHSNTALAFRTTGTGLGNVIIGVRMKYDGEEEWSKVGLDEAYPPEKREYLWSWHLWITDYDPDMVDDKSNTAFYQVPGGQVIQMGINKMMDRNLGAWAPEVTNPMNPEDIIKTFGLYYQYGRKDPFPYFNSDRVGVYDIDGNKIPAFNDKTVKYKVHTRVTILNDDGSDKRDEQGNAMYEYIESPREDNITMMTGDWGSFANGVSYPYIFFTDPDPVYFTLHWASDATSIVVRPRGEEYLPDDIFMSWYTFQWYFNYLQSFEKDETTGKIMIKKGQWAGEVWNDSEVNFRKNIMKGIFDPCPAGWVMDESTGDFYESDGSVGGATELFYGQEEYLLWKGFINSDDKEGQSVKFEDTEENWAKIDEYRKLEKEFWEDLNGENVSISGAPTAFMGSYLYYRNKSGQSYFPAAGSRNRFGGGDRFHNYMCLPSEENKMIRLTSLGFQLIKDDNSDESKKFYREEFSTATAMQVRCVRL